MTRTYKVHYRDQNNNLITASQQKHDYHTANQTATELAQQGYKIIPQIDKNELKPGEATITPTWN